MLSLFKRKVEVKPFLVPEYIVFNVDNFNNWFNDKNNGATYANPGIFLRLDKLDESHITEYIQKCYGLSGGFLWSKPKHCMYKEFEILIRTNWKEKLNERNRTRA